MLTNELEDFVNELAVNEKDEAYDKFVSRPEATQRSLFRMLGHYIAQVRTQMIQKS